MKNLLALLSAAFLLAACGGGEEAPTKEATTAVEETTVPTDEATDEPAAAGEILVAGFTYDPKSTEVPVGTEVTWTNEDDAPHTATADDGSFDVQLEPGGGSGSFTFEQPGTFPYICTLHPSMTGEVTVV